MIVERATLLALMGLEGRFGNGASLMLEDEEGDLRATARWNEDGFSADVTQALDGESSQPVLSLNGIYMLDDDSFDLEAEDLRPEASEPHDPNSVANAYRTLTRDMREVG